MATSRGKRCVGGAVHLAHATLTDDFADLVVIEAGAGFEQHRFGGNYIAICSLCDKDQTGGKTVGYFFGCGGSVLSFCS